ncbi:MAG: hypothetical protein ACYCW6_03300 [Candidatus Xenobia bacterium]
MTLVVLRASSVVSQPTARLAAPSPQPPAEVGDEKTPTQAAGNAGFAATSVLSLGSFPQIGRLVPGLNLVVGGIESYNGIQQACHGHHVQAAGHFGNAAGCLSSFGQDAARYASVFQKGSHGESLRHTMVTGALALGYMGGMFGVWQGWKEIDRGLDIKRQTGTTRTLQMGLCDFTSGAATLAGITLRLTGLAPTVGLALLLGSSVCDLTSIGIDYLASRSEKKN